MTREMRDSTVEWIGKIPKYWEIKKIKDIYNIRNTKVSDKEYMPLSVTKNGVVPQLETAAKTDNHDDRKLVKETDFVINSRSDRRGSCGISKYTGSVSLINIVLKCRNNSDSQYYNWLFHTIQFADEFYRWGHGIVDDLWTTNWEDMKNISIPVPPLIEQTRIAKYLVTKCSQIDKTISDLENLVAKEQEYKKSLITQVVTKGLDPNAEMKDSGVEWIGEIPKKWRMQKIKFISTKIYKGIQPEYQTTGIPVLNQATFSQGVIDDNRTRYSNKPTDYNDYVEFGDVVLATTGGGVLGKTAFFDRHSLYLPSTDVAVLHFKNATDGKFYYYILSLMYQYLNDLLARGSTNQTHLDMQRFVTELWPTPPDVERKAIVSFLDSKCSQIDQSIKEQESLITNLKDYKKSLIFEYVTGKKEVPHD